MQKRRLAGLEGLAGIPANVGGAVAMNAGSFGQCIGDCLHRVRCWNPQRGLIWLQREDVVCMYRSFQPKGLSKPWIIHEVELCFSPAEKVWTQRRMDEVFERKRQTQPVGAKTCGCTFKNPEEAPAGLLLDRCGMRGERIGDVSFSVQHANFLLNQGNGCFAQAMDLITEARRRVRDRFGLDLELEVQVVCSDLEAAGDTL
jgi:UDP-N-acetylmuramate dehydrogenase